MSKLDKAIRDIQESSYQDGGFGAGYPASIDADKDKIKNMFTELLGDMESRTTEDMSLKSWTVDDHKAFARNGLRTEIIKKINEL